MIEADVMYEVSDISLIDGSDSFKNFYYIWVPSSWQIM